MESDHGNRILNCDIRVIQKMKENYLKAIGVKRSEDSLSEKEPLEEEKWDKAKFEKFEWNEVIHVGNNSSFGTISEISSDFQDPVCKTIEEMHSSQKKKQSS
jgi:hypothetical protein